MTSRLSAYQCHTSFDEPCSSCNTVTRNISDRSRSHHIIPFLQPLLYNYVGTSTRDEDRDKDHKLDHDL